MEYSFYLKFKTNIDTFRMLRKKLKKKNKLQLFSQVKQIYIDSKLINSEIDKEKEDIFSQLLKIDIPISILPSSYLIYGNFGDSDEKREDYSQKYLDKFYGNDSTKTESLEELYLLKEETFEKYLSYYDKIKKLFKKDVQSIESRLLQFIAPPSSSSSFDLNKTLKKRIMPYCFLEDLDNDNILTFDEYLKLCIKYREQFNSIVIYTRINYLKKIADSKEFMELKKFKNIFIWIADFNEIYSKHEDICILKEFLEKLYKINQNIIYLFGGLQIAKWFGKIIKEIVFRIDIYPGYKIDPSKPVWARRVKRIFYPQFGRPEKVEVILSSTHKNFFKCKCINCINYYDKDGNFNIDEAINKLEDNSRLLKFHNIHSFLIKINENPEIIPEDEPDRDLNNIKLTKKWENALNECS